jgi:hypothetical protein
MPSAGRVSDGDFGLAALHDLVGGSEKQTAFGDVIDVALVVSHALSK